MREGAREQGRTRFPRDEVVHKWGSAKEVALGIAVRVLLGPVGQWTISDFVMFPIRWHMILVYSLGNGCVSVIFE